MYVEGFECQTDQSKHSISLSVSLYIYPSIYLPIYFYLSICLSI